MAKRTEYKCSCGQVFPDGRARQGHIMSWTMKEPGKHERVDPLIYHEELRPAPPSAQAVATTPAPPELATPVVKPNGHTDLITDFNEAWEPFIVPEPDWPAPAGLAAALDLEETEIVQAVAKREPDITAVLEAQGLHVAQPEAQPEPVPKKREIARGWYLIFAVILVVVVAVVVMTQI